VLFFVALRMQDKTAVQTYLSFLKADINIKKILNLSVKNIAQRKPEKTEALNSK